ncbi:MAG: hypothetical protein M0P09_01375 [Acholeplasmataceae bacterium]|nr:hypothetical protein [Acholeplasmataceae bacterium]
MEQTYRVGIHIDGQLEVFYVLAENQRDAKEKVIEYCKDHRLDYGKINFVQQK